MTTTDNQCGFDFPELCCLYCGANRYDVAKFRDAHPLLEPVCCVAAWTEIGEGAEMMEVWDV